MSVAKGTETDWSFYAYIRAILERHEPDTALKMLEHYRAGGHVLSPSLVVLEGQAFSNLGRHDAAAHALGAVVERGEADFWTWYNLAAVRRQLSDWQGAFEASQQAHALAGWLESRRHGYRYTHDYFSPNIANWMSWFRDHITAAPLHALEIGSWQGASACWLIDQVIGPRGGRLTCIDPFSGSSEHSGFLNAVLSELGTTLEGLFDYNIDRTGHPDLVRKVKGFSQDVLPGLHGELFDFIYIDGAHEAKFVIQDAVLSWGLLSDGAYMLFDDVNFTFPERPEQDTGKAIDFFLSVFAEEIVVISRERQLLIRKRPREAVNSDRSLS